MRDFFHNYDPVFFAFPIDGDCLNAHDGVLKDGVLYVKPIVKAADNAEIIINGIPAEYDAVAHTYTAELPLCHFRNTLVAIDRKNVTHWSRSIHKIVNTRSDTAWADDSP